MKYEILRDFTDKYNYSIKYKKGDVVTFSKERIEEIELKEKELKMNLIKKVVKTKRVVE